MSGQGAGTVAWQKEIGALAGPRPWQVSLPLLSTAIAIAVPSKLSTQVSTCAACHAFAGTATSWQVTPPTGSRHCCAGATAATNRVPAMGMIANGEALMTTLLARVFGTHHAFAAETRAGVDVCHAIMRARLTTDISHLPGLDDPRRAP